MIVEVPGSMARNDVPVVVGAVLAPHEQATVDHWVRSNCPGCDCFVGYYAAPEWIGRASGHPCKHQDNVDLDLGHKRYSMVHELSCGLSVIQDCWDSSDVDQILGLFRRWMMERNVNCKETLEMKHGRKLRNAHAASPHHRENRDGPMPGHTPLHGRRGGTSHA
eukprot:CAMPEP_0172863306 /NCGR_PEP_ID=MMETSP1075-20121228/76880_1 /TAXON_ID=2916 /ORGANISM="Ceratium fusus, Strain PA161109" /LENGTH=163 /DNA_ID=CAMNT_0013711861 /DNA_START=587 /DNA_END=1075 /DNA_ORIENTATION=+